MSVVDVWGDFSSESYEEIKFVAKIDDKNNEEVTLFQIRKDLKNYLLKKLKFLPNVQIDSLHDLT